MTDSEIKAYINTRNGLLCQDEVLQILDIQRNPQIDHFQLLDDKYEVWTTFGAYFSFSKRNW